MSRKIVTFVTAAALAALAPAAAFAVDELVDNQPPNAPSTMPDGSAQSAAGNVPTTQPSQQPQQQPPQGFVLLDERVIYTLINEPQGHLIRAVQALARGDKHTAAADVRLTSAYLDLQASADQGQVKQSVQNESQRLQQLAEQIENGTVRPAQVLQQFAETNFVLAEAHQQNARQALDRNQDVKAGHELQASARNYQQALVWSRQHPTQANMQTIASSLQSATRLMGPQTPPQPLSAQAQPAGARLGPEQQGQKPTTQPQQLPADQRQQASETINNLGQAIQSLGTRIQPGPSQQGQPQQQPQP
jgi:hypothetical protein